MQLQGTQNLLSHIDLTELNKAVDLGPSDGLLVGGVEGNFRLPVTDALYEIIDGVSAVTAAKDPNAVKIFSTKNMIWRGENLGSYVTNEQFEAINNGSFKNIFLGDYWIINGIQYDVVDFDYWRYFGAFGDENDENIKRIHHIVLCPHTVLYRTKYNDTKSTSGGYVNSKLYKTGLDQAKQTIYAAFGEDHIYDHKELLSNATDSNGSEIGGIWEYTKVVLMTETMVYGTILAMNSLYFNKSIFFDIPQLSGFLVNKRLINSYSQDHWLRNTRTTTRWCGTTHEGVASSWDADDEKGIRPVFGLTG